jgi:hypothetical protein
MNSNDYDCPYMNYQRLLETRDFLERKESVHEKFFDIHIEHIKKYLQVVITTEEISQTASPILQELIEQYNYHSIFNLDLYLVACNYLLGNVTEYQIHEMMQNLNL